MTMTYDPLIHLRLMLIQANTGSLLGRARMTADMHDRPFADAAQHLPFLLGELSNECDDADRMEAFIRAYVTDPAGMYLDALEMIAHHARVATMPGESWVDVEACAVRAMREEDAA